MLHQRKKIRKRILPFLMTFALLVGLFPTGHAAESRAAGHGLANPVTDENGVTKWDTIYFGNYWQSDTNGDGKADKNDEKEPIKWRVLSIDGDDAFLLADKNLDVQRYNDTETDVTWETCTMRSWLNGYDASLNISGNNYTSDCFLKNAFTSSERSAIQTTDVVNDDNPDHGAVGEGGTQDKVFLLSMDEVTNPDYGFSPSTDDTRKALNTGYVANGGEINSDLVYVAGSADDWWLRSPGYGGNDCAIIVSDDGESGWDGSVSNACAVRPAIHLNLNASSDAISTSNWSYAGTVSSDGTLEEIMPSPRPGTPSSAAPTVVPTVAPTADSWKTPSPASTQGLTNPVMDENGVTKWDTIYFGNYWQSDTNGDGKADKNDIKEPIKWRVLSISGDDAFLLADKNLDVQRYNDTYADTTWERCTMRSWLNGYGASSNQEGNDYTSDSFIKNAFSSSERSAIQTTDVINDNNPDEGYAGGNDTQDKVYLLSESEVTDPNYGFLSSTERTNTRRALNTEYVADGGDISSDSVYGFGETDYWRLRSLGYYCDWASNVNPYGYVDSAGINVNDDGIAVRPALHLNLLATSVWSYAGKVSSDGKILSVFPDAQDPADPITNKDGVMEWDTIYFGNYWQRDTNDDGKADKNDEKEPIKWRVLSVDGDDAFLLADKNLDVQRYNNTDTDTTWETCTMRSWLNGYGASSNQEGNDYTLSSFLNNAFTSSERQAIQMTNVVNNANPDFGTAGGNNTQDKVFLLSMDEVKNPEYGFSSSTNSTNRRRAWNTEYSEDGGAEYWWLRSPGQNSNRASIVGSSGDVSEEGSFVDCDYDAVRPAIHLNLSSADWSYAGKVSSYGTVEEIKPSSRPDTPSPVTPTVVPTAEPWKTPSPASTHNPANTEPPAPTHPTTALPGTPSVSSQGGSASAVPQNVTVPGSAVTNTVAPDAPQASAVLAKVTGLKLTAGKKKIKVVWKKTAGAVGYQLYYSTSKN